MAYFQDFQVIEHIYEELDVEGECEYIDICLTRGNQSGLGFSIAGGVDQNAAIYVTRIIADGVADVDGRLKVMDIITHVNDVSMENASHAKAAEALNLTRTGESLNLKVKRKKEKEDTIIVELKKGSVKGLGIRIAGGTDSQFFPDDNGIYVTEVSEGGTAQLDGRISKGDRVIALKNHPMGEFSLENCTHSEAAQALKDCKDTVVMVVAKTGYLIIQNKIPKQAKILELTEEIKKQKQIIFEKRELREEEKNEMRTRQIGEERRLLERHREESGLLEEKHERETREEYESLANMMALVEQLTGEKTDKLYGADMDAAREEFDCPVCWEPMAPPMRIWQCPANHLICNSCKTKMHNNLCPTCRWQEITGRAVTVEKIARSLFALSLPDD